VTNPRTDKAQAHRDQLVDEIVREATNTAFWTGRDHFGEAVLDAIARVPRHVFIPTDLMGDVSLNIAYANRPQTIGHGQTISQPYIVALMCDLLDLRGAERVLEIGTGSGYQCAVLAELAAQVYSIERIADLAATAQATLGNLAYDNAQVCIGDGTKGWVEHAPYDGILVTACHDDPIPQALIEQLVPGGRIVIPLGPQIGPQMLHLGVKDKNGHFTHGPVLMVSFVSLVSIP